MRSLVLICALAASASFAGAGANHPCKADRARLCPNLAKGPALHACMKAHAAELSPVCQQSRAEHQKH
jgi:hypothetical protein